MGKRESGIQKRTVDAIIKKYSSTCAMRVKHGTAYAVVGDPDVYGCVRGRFVAFEVKNEEGKLTKIQERRLMEFFLAGAITGAIRSPQDALNAIEDRLKHTYV